MNSYNTVNAAYRAAGLSAAEGVEFGTEWHAARDAVYMTRQYIPTSYGAGTGRITSRQPQFQELPRGKYPAQIVGLEQNVELRLLGLGGIAAAKVGAQTAPLIRKPYRFHVRYYDRDEGQQNLDGQSFYGVGWYVMHSVKGLVWDGPFDNAAEAIVVRDRRETEED